MLASRDDMTAEEQSAAELVKKRFGAAKRLHTELEARWTQFYGLSRNYHRLGGALTTAANPRDKDIVINEIKREFGTELFIPYAYTVIETNVPRILSRSPRYRALPTRLDEAAEAAKRPMERLYERDSENMRYERKLQETVRSGLRYGLGVQKEYWKETYKATKRVKPGILGTPLGRQVLDDRECVFKGPEVESVDIFDFFWDPTARDLATAEYVIHRTWRSQEYVEDRVRTGKWAELDLERIQGLRTQKGRGSAWDGRYRASGLSGYSTEAEEYEVLEYHDRDQVITILGGELVVQMAPNPYLHGEFPFEIYRPTLVEHEFCGIGEVEPIAHLQWELNELRGQRRDAATLALNRGYFYMAGSLDPALIKTGVGVFNPVYQPPSEVIMPMPFTDVPQSGWEEERSIKSDIELTTAMSEAVIGSGGEDTATGTQMVQQAASFRIRQKAKNLNIDLLRPETRKRKALYEQHYVGADETIPLRVEDPLTPTGFDFIEVTPEMFGVGLEVLPIDGSTEPDDPAQKKTDAGELVNALAPFMEVLDPEKVVKYIADQFDIEDVNDWIKQGPSPEEASAEYGQQVMQSIAWAMEDAGVDKEQIEQILETAYQALESEMPPGEEEQGEGEPAPESVPASRNGAPEPIGTP